MLVLSRKTNQNILFPNLGISVEILRVAGSTVKVGISAPQSVQVLRGELAQGAILSCDPPRLSHALRNQLHKAQLAVALAQKQLQASRYEDAEQTLEELLHRLKQFDAGVESAGSERDGSETVHAGNDGDAPQRALVVEDDANERTLLAGYLRLCGMEVAEAQDGMEAVEFLRSKSVDLVVLDMRMPRMNGVDTLRSLRTIPGLERTRIIVVSGEQAQHADYADVHPDITNWFAKPLDPAHLVNCL